MSIEQQEVQLRKRYEQERSRETKEGEPDQELKVAAAMERADYLVKEVKQSKKQMQNILVHMQQVMTTIRQLLAQLNLSDTDIPMSVAQDQKRAEMLKKKIGQYREELIKMKDELIMEYIENLREKDMGLNEEELKKKATVEVEQLIAAVQE